MKKQANCAISSPKISIITCVYNGEKFISRLLESVLNMGYPNIEHIIVNDGSTDGTEDIVLKYSELYNNKNSSNLNIKYIKQENMGLGSATNTGLKEVTGEYWTWINCDDWYEHHAFYEVLGCFSQYTDLVIINRYIVYKDNEKEIRQIGVSKKEGKLFSSKEIMLKKMFRYFRIKQMHFLVKTNTFDKLNPTRSIDPFRYTQDQQFTFTLFPNMNTSYCSKPVVNYLIRQDSFFNTSNKNISYFRNFIIDYHMVVFKSFKYIELSPVDKMSQINIYLCCIYKQQIYNHLIKHNFLECRNIYCNHYLVHKRLIDKKYNKYLDNKAKLYYFISYSGFLRILYMLFRIIARKS